MGKNKIETTTILDEKDNKSSKSSIIKEEQTKIKENLPNENKNKVEEQNKQGNLELPLSNHFDLFGKLDKVTGLFTIIDKKGNPQWKMGFADITKNVKTGRYLGEDLEFNGITVLDKQRWEEMLNYTKTRGGTIYMDVVEVK